MSKHVGDMRVGDEIEVKGPIQKLPYKANMKKRIGMVAGAAPGPKPPQRQLNVEAAVHHS